MGDWARYPAVVRLTAEDLAGTLEERRARAIAKYHAAKQRQLAEFDRYFDEMLKDMFRPH